MMTVSFTCVVPSVHRRFETSNTGIAVWLREVGNGTLSPRINQIRSGRKIEA